MPHQHARKCGHSSKACGGGGGFKLFGVQIGGAAAENGGVESNIRKSKSLGNLQSCDPENAAVEPSSGYLSDGLVHQSSKSHDRKKGRPWSEEEHRSFLVGLEKLGKGDWKGIAQNYVPTRNSSQVASHAQKYFIRMSATEKRRRRTSVFDIPLTGHGNHQPSLADTAAEISSTSSWLSSSKSMTGLSSTSRVPVTTAERPPLSPMKRHGSVPDFHTMLYSAAQQRVSNLSQGYAPQTVRPTVAWVPFLTYPSEGGDVFFPSTHGTLGGAHPSFAKVVGPTSVARFQQNGSSQAAGVGGAPQASNDELSLNIKSLKL